MIKRLNKVTSLVVAAAAVTSLVPATGAMAADYKRIQSEDGTIYGAVAYKDGIFFIDGELEDKDEAAYYVNNGKYTDLDESDIDSGDYESSEDSLYADKYVEIDTDLYLDLETGKVSDDEVKEDNRDDAASALRKKFRKDAEEEVYANVDELPELKEVAGNKFAELYYENAEEDETYYGNKVYTDANGKYVMADYLLGKIKVNGKTVKDIEDAEGLELTHVETLGQDKDYIYRRANLKLGETTGAAIEIGNDVTTTSDSIQVIQKISKVQGSDDFEGAVLPKTVSTYYLVDEDGEDVDFNFDKYLIVNGKITGYTYDGETLEAKTITLSSKKGLYYTDLSDGISEDEIDAVDYDVDGNLWFLQDGYLKKYDLDDDMDKVYKVDGSMDEFSVYDADNIILWSEDDEVYSIITGKSATTEEEKEEETTTATGWVQNADGTWNYLNAKETK